MPKNSNPSIPVLIKAIDDVQAVLDGQLYIECLTDWLNKTYSVHESVREKEIVNSALRLLLTYHDYQSNQKLSRTCEALSYVLTAMQYEEDFSS